MTVAVDELEFKLAMARAVRMLTRREHSEQVIRRGLAEE